MKKFDLRQFQHFDQIREQERKIRMYSESGVFSNEQEIVHRFYSDFVDDLNDTSYDRTKDQVGRDWPSHTFNCFKHDLMKKFRVS